MRHASRIAVLMNLLRRQEAAVVLAMVMAATGIICFVLVAGNVPERHTQRFDESVLRSLRRPDDPAVPVGPTWAPKAARDISALGSLSVLFLVMNGV